MCIIECKEQIDLNDEQELILKYIQNLCEICYLSITENWRINREHLNI